MKRFKILAALVAIFAAGAARADTIIGGFRQAHDAAHCAAYEPTFAGHDLPVPGLGTVQFGPEAPIPGFLSLSNPTPAQHYAVDRWGVYSQLHAQYRDIRANTTQDFALLGPTIGYDQLLAAFLISEGTFVGQTGPVLAMPSSANYPGLQTDPEVHRAYRIAKAKWSLSFAGFLTAAQLDQIEDVLLQTPTCDGVAY